MDTIFFWIAFPLSMLVGLFGAVAQVPLVIKRYREGIGMEEIVSEMVENIETTAPLSWYLDMPEFGKALLALFFYSLLLRIFI